MDSSPIPAKPWWKMFQFGPGMIVAITGIGASDVISATVGGATYGTSLLWAVAIGAFFKWVLNDGIARWQIGTETSIIHGWAAYLPRWVLVIFFVYLLVWIVGVSAALTSGCGLAIENLSHGTISSFWGGTIHSLLGALLIITGHGRKFQGVIKLLAGIMFVSVVGCAMISSPDLVQIGKGLFIPLIPSGSNTFVLSLMGGIGGTLTILSYNYLEQPLQKAEYDSRTKWELMQAYFFTGIFGISIMIIAADVFHKNGIRISDQHAVTKMAEQLGSVVGPIGFYLYSLGFWATVTASLLGVWKTVPLMTADCFRVLLKKKGEPKELEKEKCYWIALALVTFAPIPLLGLGKPLVIIILFTILGSLFIPFLAFTLLYLNFRAQNQERLIRNTFFQNMMQFAILILFTWIGFQEVKSFILKLF